MKGLINRNIDLIEDIKSWFGIYLLLFFWLLNGYIILIMILILVI